MRKRKYTKKNQLFWNNRSNNNVKVDVSTSNHIQQKDYLAFGYRIHSIMDKYIKELDDVFKEFSAR